MKLQKGKPRQGSLGPAKRKCASEQIWGAPNRGNGVSRISTMRNKTGEGERGHSGTEWTRAGSNPVQDNKFENRKQNIDYVVTWPWRKEC